MTDFLQYNDNRTGYVDTLGWLLAKGKKVPSRVGDTLEVEDVTIKLHDPRRAMPTNRPGYNKGFGLLEAAQLVGGFHDEEAMKLALPKIADFTDFHGAYGKRVALRDQVRKIIKMLRDDPGTRRAVIALWDAGLDINGGHTDHPCTIAITFRIRDGALNMTVHMRSNDIWRGWAYDCVQFAQLQITIASFVGVRVGTYTHHADSFHIYERDLEAAQKMLDDPYGRGKEYVLTGFKGRHTNFTQMTDELKKRIVTAGSASIDTSEDAKTLLWEMRRYIAREAGMAEGRTVDPRRV